MLTSDQLDVLPGPILDLYERFHISILEDIARRVASQLYTSAAWQVQRMIEAGLLYDDLLHRIAELTGESERTLRRIFEKAGVTAMRFDDAIYKAAGLKPLPLNLSPQMTRILSIGLRKTAGLLRNLTLTTARSGQELFIAATDLAYMQISTGALDYATAVREAVKEMAGQGLEVIYYESGHRDKIDVAVRRAVLTGVSQTAGELTEARADEMGTDLVQTSAHLGARNKGDVPENHEMWQGQVFTRGKDPANAAYPNFYEVTGYMTITGLYGINCVVGDTRVSGPSIRAAYRRKYAGELIVIRTTRGHELTVTPNHPILTQHGWVAADAITEGDNVFSCSNLDRESRISPNVNKSQPLIQQVFSTLNVGSIVSTFPASAGNFHGDVADHEIDVVYPDSFLWDRFYTQVNKIPIKVFFGFPVQLPSFLFASGAFGEVNISSLHTSNSIVSGFRKLFNFFGGHSINSIFHSIRSIISDWYAQFLKIFTNRSLGYSRDFGNFVLPHTRFVHMQKIGGLNSISAADVGFPIVSTSINTIPLQAVDNSAGGTAVLVCNSSSGDAIVIHSDNVVSVERKSTQGSFIHVYNLSTEGEWYFANNIITHNCRHSHYPFFKGISENAYKQATLDEYANETVTYNGKEMSYYDATQIQRKFEREIRKARREQAALEAAGRDSFEEQAKARELRAGLKDFLKQTGLSRKYERERMGFVPSVSVDRDLQMAQQGKLFDLQSIDTETVYSKPLDYSSQYNDSQIMSDKIVLEQREKAHIWKTHEEDREWLAKNQDLVLKAISDPMFVENVPRSARRGSVNIAHIIYIGEKNLPFLNVVINFKGTRAKIWTMFRVSKLYIYCENGILQERWTKKK
jgi:hypothetical protein